MVTEKKIISLKKKSADQTATQSIEPSTGASPSKPLRQLTTGRKSLTETKTTAVVKPVLKRTAPTKLAPADDPDEIDEDELLADTPPSSPVRITAKPIAKVIASSSGLTTAKPATNRRIVLRNDASADDAKSITVRKVSLGSVRSRVATTAASSMPDEDTHKGIFDRLDRKTTTIGIPNAAKRKIARIVINNSD